MNTFFEIMLYSILFFGLFCASFMLYKECKTNYKYVTLKKNNNAITYLKEDQTYNDNEDFIM
jgi:hypothetical protein